MDLNTVTELRTPRSRAELDLAPGDTLLAGGTWLFSEPQPHLRVLVDLTTLGWPDLEVHDGGLRIGATCPINAVSAFVAPPDWRAAPLLRQCCTALYGSFKVGNVATVGGNICLALPAGPMTSLTTGLDGVAVVWTPGGGERRIPVVDLVTGPTGTSLEPGEVLRSVELPLSALRAVTAYRQISLSPLGRSGALVIGRRDADGSVVLTVTASTPRPVQWRFAGLPSVEEVDAAIAGVGEWYDDAHGAPDWRAHTTALLAREVRSELAETVPA